MAAARGQKAIEDAGWAMTDDFQDLKRLFREEVLASASPLARRKAIEAALTAFDRRMSFAAGAETKATLPQRIETPAGRPRIIPLRLKSREVKRSHQYAPEMRAAKNKPGTLYDHEGAPRIKQVNQSENAKPKPALAHVSLIKGKKHEPPSEL